MTCRGRSSRLPSAALLLALLGACAGTAPGPQTAPAETAGPAPRPTVVADEGRLWVELDGERRLLFDDGKRYAAHVSPDGRFIVVDVELLSNLQVTRLVAFHEESREYRPTLNLSEEAWRAALAPRAVAIDDVLYPRTRFVEWSADGRAFTLEVTGVAPDGGEIHEIRSVPLD